MEEIVMTHDEDDIPRKPVLIQIAAWIWIAMGLSSLFLIQVITKGYGESVPIVSLGVLVVSVGWVCYGIGVLLGQSGGISIASIFSILLGMNSLRVTIFIAFEVYAYQEFPTYLHIRFAFVTVSGLTLILAGVFAFITRKQYYRYCEWINKPHQTSS